MQLSAEMSTQTPIRPIAFQHRGTNFTEMRVFSVRWRWIFDCYLTVFVLQTPTLTTLPAAAHGMMQWAVTEIHLSLYLYLYNSVHCTECERQCQRAGRCLVLGENFASAYGVLYSPLHTARFNIQQFYVLPTQCIYVFCVDLKTNSDYFPIQH
jgi:hypothetical protein